MSTVKQKLKIVFMIIVYAFALWGFVLTLVFFAMKFGLTTASSAVDAQSEYFKRLQSASPLLGSSINVTDGGKKSVAEREFSYVSALDEWPVIKAGITKDADVIERVSYETGISKRLLVAPLIVEQLRLMTSEREVFKRYFQPLSVLGTQTQFSLGIYGIKEGTARQIEDNLKNTNSPYYLGAQYEHLLDYGDSTTSLVVDADTLEPIKDASDAGAKNVPLIPPAPPLSVVSPDATTSTAPAPAKTVTLFGSDAERIKRLTDEHNRYYSYLYAALYLKEIMSQWKHAGYDISDRPEILMTVYNLGLAKSKPKADPQVGGAVITLNGKDYTFGSLAFYFYYSDELRGVFD
ncbi:MAG: hypothetical protein HGA67_03815 [Candidatus Yonathbacteria bacterium]|nr:hypothetical protein [Candidatus Yonathbacteria bacterium]